MPSYSIAILGIYAGFGLLELWRSRLFAKAEQTRDDGIVEAVSTTVLMIVSQPLIVLASGALDGAP